MYLGGIANIAGNANISGIAYINNSTVSTSTSTGALVVSGTGGVGIGGNINVGGNANISGIANINNSTVSTSTSTGALVVTGTGGVGIGGNLWVGGTINGTLSSITGILTLPNGTVSTSTSTGTLVVTGTGGIGVGGNVNVGSALNVNGTINSSQTDNNFSISVTNRTTGINGRLTVLTASTNGAYNPSTVASDSLILFDNIATANTGNLNICPWSGSSSGIRLGQANVKVNYTANSTSTTSGALQVSGGTGITGNLWVGGSINGNGSIPIGGIILWSGATTSIPTGWSLCNGTNGTPNLQDRFVVGAGSSYAVNATGGSATVTLSTAEIPAHTHTYQVTNTSSDNTTETGVQQQSFVKSSSKVVTPTTSSGDGGAHENRPPYYALAYIMRTV
jgi:microcystin-dependent protein